MNIFYNLLFYLSFQSNWNVRKIPCPIWGIHVLDMESSVVDHFRCLTAFPVHFLRHDLRFVLKGRKNYQNMEFNGLKMSKHIPATPTTCDSDSFTSIFEYVQRYVQTFFEDIESSRVFIYWLWNWLHCCFQFSYEEVLLQRCPRCVQTTIDTYWLAW